jgi:SRSO17 transposase
VSVHLVNERASCAADWRLFCPESWDDVALAGDPVAAARAKRRRERAGIPGQVRHTEKWRLALEMIDEMTGPAGWGLLEQITAAGGARPVVVADAGYGEGAGFRLGLAGRGWRYVIAVKGSVSARPHDAVPAAWAYGGMGRPSVRRYRTAPVSLRQLTIAHADQVQQVTWRQGTKITRNNPAAAMTSHFIAIRVRPASRRIPRADDGSLPECWLLAEWPPDADEPSDYWLSNLPPDTPVTELVRLAKIRWRVEHDYRELKTGLGLDHFEGRSFTGWHRHVTLAALAQVFITMIRTDPKAPAPG